MHDFTSDLYVSSMTGGVVRPSISARRSLRIRIILANNSVDRSYRSNMRAREAVADTNSDRSRFSVDICIFNSSNYQIQND